jgi:tetratricopeptide (TPR) repeat protein
VLTFAAKLRVHIKRALLGLRREDGGTTAREQSAARDLCHGAGRLQDAVRMELTLGGYLSQLRQPERAQESFERAAKAAAGADAHALEAQARYAEAYAWKERKKPEDALRCYWAGIEAAKKGRHVRLVFDGYWEAGLLLRPLDRASTLVSLWSDALRTAGDYSPAELRRTRIEKIASELAVELRALRRAADARAVDEWVAQALGKVHAP